MSKLGEIAQKKVSFSSQISNYSHSYFLLLTLSFYFLFNFDFRVVSKSILDIFASIGNLSFLGPRQSNNHSYYGKSLLH